MAMWHWVCDVLEMLHKYKHSSEKHAIGYISEHLRPNNYIFEKCRMVLFVKMTPNTVWKTTQRNCHNNMPPNILRKMPPDSLCYV